MAYLFLLVYIVFLCKNFKWTVIITGPLAFIFHTQFYLIPEKITFFSTLTIISFFYYVFLKKHKYPLDKNNPLKSCMLFYLLFMFIHGFYPTYHPYVIFFVNSFPRILFWFLWYSVIKTNEDLKLVVKVFLFCVYFIIGNGLIELIFKINPIGNLMINLSGFDFISENTTMRFGFSRITSLYPHGTSLGSACTLILYLLSYLFLQQKECISKINKNSIILAISFLLLGIILSNSRTPLFGLILVLPFLINKRLLSGKSGMLLLCCTIIFLFIFYDYIEYMYDITFHENKYDAEGSSSDLRKAQFGVAYKVMSEYPIFGAGSDYDPLKYFAREDVLGMESVWFPMMYKSGLLGIISYVFIFWITFWKSIKKGDLTKYLFGFTFLWLVMNTLSSLPGIYIENYIMIVLFMYKVQKYNTIHFVTKYSMKI